MEGQGSIRVVVCDDHGPYRRGLVELLSVADDVAVIGEAADHGEAVAVVLDEGPDVVLLDLEMTGMGADESMERMLGASQPPGIVIFSMHDEPGTVRRFLRRGAAAYLSKSALTDELLGAVRDAARSTHDDVLPGEEEAIGAREDEGKGG